MTEHEPLVKRSGAYLGRWLGGDPSTIRPIPADIVEEEQS